MTTSTHTLIYESEVPSSGAVLDITNFPQNYKDLQIVHTVRMPNIVLPITSFNNDSSNIYQEIFLGTYGPAAVYENNLTNNVRTYVDGGASHHIAKTEILDYSSSNKQKNAITFIGQGSGELGLVATRYMSTSPITQITFNFPQTYNVQQRIHLVSIYGIMG